MSPSVDLYGNAYGNFAARVFEQVRRETYDEDFGQSSWVTGGELRRFIHLLELTVSDNVLDIGCGSGGPALFLARTLGCRVTGVDVNAAGIDIGLVLARQVGLQDQVQFRRSDLREPLPFADQVFDVVVCLDVLCHLPERRRLFDEWYRVLRPGGRMLCTDPVVVSGLVSGDEFRTRSSTGYFEFCPSGVNERLFRDAGFELVRADDATQNEVEVSHRWHAARQQRATELITLEGAEAFAGLQQFLVTVHRLAAERRLSRIVYLGRKPTPAGVNALATGST